MDIGIKLSLDGEEISMSEELAVLVNGIVSSYIKQKFMGGKGKVIRIGSGRKKGSRQKGWLLGEKQEMKELADKMIAKNTQKTQSWVWKELGQKYNRTQGSVYQTYKVMTYGKYGTKRLNE